MNLGTLNVKILSAKISNIILGRVITHIVQFG